MASGAALFLWRQKWRCPEQAPPPPCQLANSPRSFVTTNLVDFDLRSLIYPQSAVVVKVALIHVAACYRDLIEQRGAEPKDEATLDLGAHCVRIDHHATIDSDRHTTPTCRAAGYSVYRQRSGACVHVLILRGNSLRTCKATG